MKTPRNPMSKCQEKSNSALDRQPFRQEVQPCIVMALPLTWGQKQFAGNPLGWALALLWSLAICIPICQRAFIGSFPVQGIIRAIQMWSQPSRDSQAQPSIARSEQKATKLKGELKVNNNGAEVGF